MGKNQLTINYSDNDILISRGETKPKNFLFRLHNHEDYEIYIFISGDVIYNIEGRDYKLTPYDMLFVRPDEMHRVFHVNENSTYKRMIINITDNFFSQNGIEDFKARLIERSMSEDRKIRGGTVIESGMRDICDKLHTIISTDNTRSVKAVINALVVEMIYTMCNVDFFDKSNYPNSKIQNAIDYINDHFTEEITLDTISKKTFISKHHLCRVFKQTTGYTVGEYINHKRLMQVSFLYKNKGLSLKEACDKAGFSSYSGFYRAYKNENGISPKEGLKL